MPDIASNLTDIPSNILDVQRRIAAVCQRAGRNPAEVTLVAISKGFDAPAVRAAFQAGLRHFGENRIQEAQRKLRELGDLTPRPTWHMVGHLQTNKAKLSLKLFDIIQSIDSLNLAQEVSRLAQQPVPVLLEVNVAGEASKTGFALPGMPKIYDIIRSLPNLRVNGLMTVAPMVSNPEEVRPVFRQLRLLRDLLEVEQLSMGMTDDFEVAIEEGATMVRLGRAIFGARNM